MRVRAYHADGLLCQVQSEEGDKESSAHRDEEPEARHPGDLSRLWDQGLQDWRLKPVSPHETRLNSSYLLEFVFYGLPGLAIPIAMALKGLTRLL